MSLEIEQNFYNFDIDSIRQILGDLGATRKVYLFRVYEFFDESKDLLIRLRDEDHRKTFTMKKRMKKNNKYETEYEINISDIEMAKKMLELLGITFDDNSYSEKIREAFYYKKSEIAIDYVPGIATFMQIESPTEKELFSIAKKLKLNLEDTAMNPFTFYGIDKTEFRKLPTTFSKMKNMKKLVTKEKAIYNKFTQNQMNMYREVIS